ncbi:MAG: LapA family protein [Bacteroidota bacterium]
MHQRTLIFGLVISILAVIFALQNADPVLVKLWFWKFESSLALVLLVFLAIGAILGILFSIPTWRAKQKTVKMEKEQEVPVKKDENKMEE